MADAVNAVGDFASNTASDVGNWASNVWDAYYNWSGWDNDTYSYDAVGALVLFIHVGLTLLYFVVCGLYKWMKTWCVAGGARRGAARRAHRGRPAGAGQSCFCG